MTWTRIARTAASGAVGLLATGLLGGGAGAQERQPGLHLDVDEVRAIAGRVRAGRSLQPTAWPNGARVAVMISFDVDNDTTTIVRNAEPSIGALSQGEYGARVGLQRVVDLMDRHEIPGVVLHSGGQPRAAPGDGRRH